MLLDIMYISKIAFFCLIIVIILLVKHFSKGKNSDPFKDVKRPPSDIKPTTEVENDKIIVLKNAAIEDVIKVVTEFCNAYNKQSFQVIAKIEQSNNEIRITFPYDIDFIMLCIFVNYLYFPFEMDYSPEIEVWTTVLSGGEEVIELIEGEKVFLFLPEGTSQYDKIFLTTEDNITYKVDLGGNTNRLIKIEDNDVFKYYIPPISDPNQQILKSYIIS